MVLILNMIFKIMKRQLLLLSLFCVSLCFLKASARAEVLAGREEVLRRVYGENCQWVPRPVTLTAAEKGSLEKRLGSRLLSSFCDLWEIRCHGRLEGIALVDEEWGKHQPITFLVAMDSHSRIKHVELLVYRERYGGGVRAGRFTGQFKDKSSADPLKIGKDLDAVSGATISSKALSLGVRKAVMLADHFLLQKPL